MTQECFNCNGYCERHKMQKNAYLVNLCKTREDYRALWDKQANYKEEPQIEKSIIQNESIRDKALAEINKRKAGLGEKKNIATADINEIYLINLKRRPDRLKECQKQFKLLPYPPLVIEAIDGWLNCPPDWYSGQGSYGCCQSHIKVLKDAIDNDYQRILVLEDDFILDENFDKLLPQIMKKLPIDWQFCYLGGQHWSRPEPFSDGILKITNIQRTHSYMINGIDNIKWLYNLYSSMKTGHIDHISGHLMNDKKAYCPKILIVGQSEGFSDIACRSFPTRFWCDGRRKNAIELRLERRLALEKAKYNKTTETSSE